MRHLLISREYPPCTYPVGGIGTYVQHIARLLAAHGETVHVIAEQWDEAPLARQVLLDGRLIVHRVSMRRPLPVSVGGPEMASADVLDAMASSAFPAQAFSWQAALLAEHLIDTEGIDVVEAQDYEAPLYYLLLRRSTGLGPARRPPCFVHLHTTRELVCHANGWGLRSAHDLVVKRFEDAAIWGADALLSPSAFLAAHTERQYGLRTGSITRIPYPIGDVPLVERSADTWSGGTICYFGRFEVRKGVIEWMEAAVDAARRRPDLRFEFIGADTPVSPDGAGTVRAALESQVPVDLRACFSFSDALDRPRLWARLRHARFVVVPSRFENFPNTCIEAMCSGVPVLASPHGGMAEMIDDGRTGWVARSGQPSDLAETLARAIATPADALADMGRAASASIRELCDNETTIARQLAFRHRLIEAGPERSLRVPAPSGWLPASAGAPAGPPVVAAVSRPPSASDILPTSEESRGAAPDSASPSGIAIVVQDVAGANLEACLATFASQTQAPVAVAVVPIGGHHRTLPAGVSVFTTRGASWIDALRDIASSARAVVVVDAFTRLDPAFVARCHGVLVSDPAIGVVTTWLSRGSGRRGVELPMPPALPWVWADVPVQAPVVIRAEALTNLRWTDDGGLGLSSFQSLALPVVAAGWQGATVPCVLVQRAADSPSAGSSGRDSSAAAVRAETVRHHPELSGMIGTIADLMTRASETDQRSGPAARGVPDVAAGLALVRRAIRNPRYTASWIAWQVKRRLKA